MSLNFANRVFSKSSDIAIKIDTALSALQEYYNQSSHPDMIDGKITHAITSVVSSYKRPEALPIEDLVNSIKNINRMIWETGNSTEAPLFGRREFKTIEQATDLGLKILKYKKLYKLPASLDDGDRATIAEMIKSRSQEDINLDDFIRQRKNYSHEASLSVRHHNSHSI